MGKKKTFRTMDVILAILACFLLAFTIAMLCVYCCTGGIPDTLCTCVFGICGGECGVMGWIRTTKDRHQERQYELEDREQGRVEPKDGADLEDFGEREGMEDG